MSNLLRMKKATNKSWEKDFFCYQLSNQYPSWGAKWKVQKLQDFLYNS